MSMNKFKYAELQNLPLAYDRHPEKCSLCTIPDDDDHAMHATSHRARVLHARINWTRFFSLRNALSSWQTLSVMKGDTNRHRSVS